MLRRALIVSLAISMMTHCALGQSTFGTIVGVVKDPGGLVVAGAPDQLSNLDDKSSRDAVADGDGWFQFLNVKPGKYAVEVQASAFAGFKMPSVQLDARQTLRVDVALKLAGNSEVVEVSDQAPVINTESATIGDT
ncbi:MAG: hypothetical protein JWO91_3107, partial [Acidobacteriaceae bacterium]|nr:hypothetical protein [Acidobacteriaceae bacterium]